MFDCAQSAVLYSEYIYIYINIYRERLRKEGITFGDSLQWINSSNETK